jgi:hypothetical protein
MFGVARRCRYGLVSWVEFLPFLLRSTCRAYRMLAGHLKTATPRWLCTESAQMSMVFGPFLGVTVGTDFHPHRLGHGAIPIGACG